MTHSGYSPRFLAAVILKMNRKWSSLIIKLFSFFPDLHGKPRVTFREDVMAGIMMAGALTQWNAATGGTGIFGGSAGGASGGGAPIGVSAGVPWDWGMGWGWAGWTPEGAVVGATAATAFCGSCALEQHQMASALASIEASSSSPAAANSSTAYHNLPYNGRHEFYYDDDNELGELGETDVGCDFGGDFGGF